MSIQDSLNAAKAKLEAMMKDRRFKKANLKREEQIELMTAQAACRGKLELCQRDFDRIIREQSRYIREGQAIGADTLIQEQMLWDAAIGYMLVRDAIYSLRTINTHTSLSHAYEMLDLVTKTTSGKKSGLPLKTVRDRNVYGYVTSAAAYQEKSELLDTFFEELKVTGKIEDCLNHLQRPGSREAALRNAYANGSPLPDQPSVASDGDENSAMARLRGLNPQPEEETDFKLSRSPLSKGNDYIK